MSLKLKWLIIIVPLSVALIYLLLTWPQPVTGVITEKFMTSTSSGHPIYNFILELQDGTLFRAQVNINEFYLFNIGEVFTSGRFVDVAAQTIGIVALSALTGLFVFSWICDILKY